MISRDSLSNDLETLLRERGGPEGLAAQLGQNQTYAERDEPAANDNQPRARVELWRRLLDSLFRRGR
jgi:hypothetical protein